ncbi:MAG: EamA family transporter [Candidatus Riflebacteria bacterium]|nr:EamA family transporter [Candidatus Riflebacteria bacterium]
MKPFFFLSIAVLAFSSIEVVVSPIRGQINPFALTFWRFALAAFCLLPMAFRTKEKKRLPTSLREFFSIAFLGVLNVVISMGAHAVSIANCRPSTAAIIIASNPMFTNFFAWIFLKEELNIYRISSILVGFSGVFLIAFKGVSGIDTHLGIITGLLGAIGFSLYTVLSKRTVNKFGSLNNALIGFIFGCLFDLPLLWLGQIEIIPHFNLWPRLLFLGIVVSGIGYLAFFKALSLLSAGKTSLLFFLKPPVAMLLAWFVLSDSPTIIQIIGTVLIMIGILIDKKSEVKNHPEGMTVLDCPSQTF